MSDAKNLRVKKIFFPFSKHKYVKYKFIKLWTATCFIFLQCWPHGLWIRPLSGRCLFTSGKAATRSGLCMPSGKAATRSGLCLPSLAGRLGEESPGHFLGTTRSAIILNSIPILNVTRNQLFCNIQNDRKLHKLSSLAMFKNNGQNCFSQGIRIQLSKYYR